MKIRCTNTYSDRESVQHHDIPDTELPVPAANPNDFESMELLWDFLWEFTGDGSGEDEHGWYEVEILESSDPALVGLSNEWSG